MKKHIPSFSAGFVTAVLLLALCTTALAASGKVSYNFASVSLNGEVKVTAGQDITAANGQKVPGTILYTDAAGGKTNYLPIRAVSELLGVEIGYDSSTKTVLLGGQSAAKEPASTAEDNRQWQRELGGEDGGIHYTWPGGGEVQDYGALPTLRPTWLPEGYLLLGAGTAREGVRNDSITWSYVKDETSGTKITFTCYRPTSRSRGSNFGIGLDTAALRRDASVQGRPADFYQIYDDFSILVWEDDAGNLLWLQGTQDQATYERIAASVRDVQDEPLPALGFGWMPEGFTRDASGNLAVPAIVEESWSKVTQTEGQPKETVTCCWFYSREALFSPKSTQPETVKVNGAQAQFWPGDPDARSSTAAVNGKTIAISADQTGTLVWTDPETKIHFRLEAPFDRNTMIRMAESVTRK